MKDATTALDMGNEQTYDLLFKKLYRPLSFFAYKILQDKAKAEDVVQDCLLKLWLKKAHFSKFESAQSFLYQSVKNACFDELDHQKVKLKHENYLQQLPIPTEQTTLDLIMQAEVLRKVVEAIDTLPLKCKEVIHLTYNEGKSIQEIAKELGVTVSTVTNQKLRGIAMLRKRLSESEIVLLLTFVDMYVNNL